MGMLLLLLLLPLLIVVSPTCGVLGVVVVAFDIDEEKDETSLFKDAFVGVMRCGEDLGVLGRDCPVMSIFNAL